MSQKSFWPVVGISLPSLVLAGMGLTHPHHLTVATAPYWTTLHALLLPIFPLLGLNLWWLAAGIPGTSAWVMRGTGFVYVVFYGALDVLSGIGTGLLVQKGLAPNSAQVSAFYDTGNALSEIGVWAFLLGCVVTVFLYWQLIGNRALVAGVLLCGAAVSFLNSHIYPPVGVVTQLVMGVGFALLMHGRIFHSRR